MENDSLNFELPTNFVDNARYKVEEKDLLPLENMPRVVSEHVIRYGGPDMPMDALNPFFFLKRGELPYFVLNWFMGHQPKRLATMTRFYRALHLMEMYRGYCHNLLHLDTPEDSTGEEGDDEA